MSYEKFINRHIGPREDHVLEMLSIIGVKSLDELIDRIVPRDIRLTGSLKLPKELSEYQYFNYIKEIASKNRIFRSYIGTGYYNTVFPAVIKRNILENPSWYTSYTPYQAEISQGRLEALLNFQTMIIELTAMEIANASLLDEATAAAEAMTMLFNARSREQIAEGKDKFYIDENIFPQTFAVLQSRAEPLEIKLVKGSAENASLKDGFFGLLIQYPAADGSVRDYKPLVETTHNAGCAVVVAADLLSLVLLIPPGEWGADVVIGSAQRFGLPMGFGGPHAAFFATRESFKRYMPGRIIGVSKDRRGKRALRMALQTREQHIKREKATSNICTAQALLATMAGMYAVYHGAEGLTQIASQIHNLAYTLGTYLEKFGYKQQNAYFFDTLKIKLPSQTTKQVIRKLSLEKKINLRYYEDDCVGISIDETTRPEDINELIEIFATAVGKSFVSTEPLPEASGLNKTLVRKSKFLTPEVFSRYRSETEIMRYIKKLERKDISLTDSMISLGSCTMKLNAAIELLPLSWPEFGEMHPFVPKEQSEGYRQLLNELENILKEVTGFDAVSFQPNSGAAGEYAGLMVIREYHRRNRQAHRNIVLVPSSAHGTNPASAVMAGMQVCVVNCDEQGNIDVSDLKNKAGQHADNLAALMVTYPSTHGVFELNIKEITDIVHAHGGQVYMDGANMNAQVGLTNPSKIGADVCHLNLHKTFAIPHGGGGPGVGPICVASHLAAYLPTHPLVHTGGNQGIPAVASGPWGSASILVISHAYCYLLGSEGLTRSSKIAILNANYLASRLKDNYGVVYQGKTGYVAHELILECRQFKKNYNISEADIAKRLMDYGFHAPTLSFPVHGTLMIEPTESESKEELDRFIEVMLTIRNEIENVSVQTGADDNVLKNAPHCLDEVTSDEWNHGYTRQQAAFPLSWLHEKKYWPPVSRIDDAFGDRNLICTCGSTSDYQSI
jgi:glycine dehydrogenase